MFVYVVPVAISVFTLARLGQFAFLRHVLVFILFFYCIAIFGFRYGIGNDYFGLQDLYELASKGTLERIREPVFYLLVDIVNVLGLPFSALIFLYSAICFSLLFFSTRSLEARAFLFFFILTSGFILFGNDQVRQASGVCFLVFGLLRCSGGRGEHFKNSRVVLLMLAAGLFHFSFLILAFCFALSLVVSVGGASRAWVMLSPIAAFPAFGLGQVLVPTITGMLPVGLEARFLYNDDFAVPVDTGFPLMLFFEVLVFSLFLRSAKDLPKGVRYV